MAKKDCGGQRGPRQNIDKSDVYTEGRPARASRRGGNGTGACQVGAMSAGVSVPFSVAWLAAEAGTSLAAAFSAGADFSFSLALMNS
jgi:hypothetical protein